MDVPDPAAVENLAAEAKAATSRPKLTQAIRSRLTTLTAMICFEGNIAPYALASNQSYHEQTELLAAGYDDDGKPWEPPSRFDILGKLLVSCYNDVRSAILKLSNPNGRSWTLTTDGWDTASASRRSGSSR